MKYGGTCERTTSSQQRWCSAVSWSLHGLELRQICLHGLFSSGTTRHNWLSQPQLFHSGDNPGRLLFRVIIKSVIVSLKSHSPGTTRIPPSIYPLVTPVVSSNEPTSRNVVKKSRRRSAGRTGVLRNFVFTNYLCHQSRERERKSCEGFQSCEGCCRGWGRGWKRKGWVTRIQ